MESSSVSRNKLLLLAFVLLLFAPVLQPQARKLGACSQAEQHVGGLPTVLVLPSGSGDDDGAAVVVPPNKLKELPGVSRPGGRAPPAPQPGYRPQPGHEPLQDVVVSSADDVTGNQKRAPPSPAGNPPPHYRYRRLGPAADLLRVFWDALARVMWLLPERLLNRSLKG